MRHQIKMSDIGDFGVSNELAASLDGEKTTKSLAMFTNPSDKEVWFVVNVHGHPVATVSSFENAAKIYNGIDEE